jgi:hypothetical protein
MKIILYPLIGILYLSTIAHVASSFNSEVGVVMAGLVASSLIGAIYFSPITITILLAVKKLGRKMLSKVSQLKPIATLIPVGLILLYIGEILTSPTIVMTATGITVVFTTALTAGTIALKIVKNF